MNKTMMALALGFLGALTAAGVGCGKNACETLADDSADVLSCLAASTSTSTSATSGSATCDDAAAKLAECQDACLDLADCACIKDPMSDAACADKNTKYNDCNTKCTQ